MDKLKLQSNGAL